MGFIDNKSNIFKEIGVNRALTESGGIFNNTSRLLQGASKLNSFPSVKDKAKNIIPFFIDLILSLEGSKKIEEIFEKIIKALGEIEQDVKNILYELLKEQYLCNYTGTIPTWLIDGSFRVGAKSIDPFNMFVFNPNSGPGALIYDTNLNSFIHDQVLQNPGSARVWQNLIEFTYNTSDDSITIRVLDSTQTINDFFISYLNSINLFPKENLYAKFMDNLFGSVSSGLRKTKDEIETEKKLEMIFSKMLNTENTVEVIDDSYFKFTNSELSEIERLSADIVNGEGTINLPCGEIPMTLPFDSILSGATTIKNSPELITVKDEIIKSINQSIDSSPQISNDDKDSSRNFFIIEFIIKLPLFLLSILISPKIMLLFNIGHMIANNTPLNQNDAIDFIKKNKNLIFKLVGKIMGVVLKLMWPTILKGVTDLVSKILSNRIKEQGALYLKAIASLTGANKALESASGIIKF